MLGGWGSQDWFFWFFGDSFEKTLFSLWNHRIYWDSFAGAVPRAKVDGGLRIGFFGFLGTVSRKRSFHFGIDGFIGTASQDQSL